MDLLMSQMYCQIKLMIVLNKWLTKLINLNNKKLVINKLIRFQIIIEIKLQMPI